MGIIVLSISVINKRKEAAKKYLKKKIIVAPCSHILTRGPRKGQIVVKIFTIYHFPLNNFVKHENGLTILKRNLYVSHSTN